MTALPTRRGAILGAVLVSGALILSGCAAGQKAATANEVPVVDGVTANIGAINLRALTIATPSGGSYAAGSNAQVQLFIINNSSTPDQLLSVSSSSAKSVVIYPTAAAATPSPTDTTSSVTPTDSSSDSTSPGSTSAGSTDSSSPSDTTSGTDTSSGEAPSSEAPSTPVASTSSAPAPTTIALPSGEAVLVGISDSGPVIVITGLNAQLFPAMTIPITFNFAHAGSVTLQVSVHLSTGPVQAPTLATGHESSD